MSDELKPVLFIKAASSLLRKPTISYSQMASGPLFVDFLNDYLIATAFDVMCNTNYCVTLSPSLVSHLSVAGKLSQLVLGLEVSFTTLHTVSILLLSFPGLNH